MILPLLLRTADVRTQALLHWWDGYLFKEKNKQSGRCMSVTPVFEFKVILLYILNLRSAWDTGDVTSKHKLSR